MKKFEAAPMVSCQTCKGSGVLKTLDPDYIPNSGDVLEQEVPCDDCGGYGRKPLPIIMRAY